MITLTQMHTQTDAANDNTRRPKLASGKKGIILFSMDVTDAIKSLYQTLYLADIEDPVCQYYD